MELKGYQIETLKQVKRYLEALAESKAKNDKAMKIDTEYAFDFPLKAWEKVVGTAYHSKKNGLGEHLPNFYLKIPTGGGKTILACHAVDLINRTYRRRQTGIVLWIVPTTQIYRQTIVSLRNREHPYRQVLDIASGGRTVILEKMDKFTPLDVTENLVIMMLMLPSASRKNKETLKVFKDSGNFTEFFPSEDQIKDHEALLRLFPNLDCFGDANSFYGKTAKTSLGNALKTLKPVIIIDEGHKAYSENAQNTIRGFNPSIILELSATPPRSGNILVNISGQELNGEEMIKLDLHITNKASLEWEDTMRAALDKRLFLERKAREYEANTGDHIRPICLIQVERTGEEQKGRKYIHAEDVKEYLIKQCGVSVEEIAIKSSEKDDIEGIDLFSKDCRIRYIITKYALQEGWDCAFAYILTILTNPSSEVSITQLVGRILRQPKARKTKVKELDESYVFCFRPRAKDILENIRKGFEAEGLGDLAARITMDEGDGASVDATKERVIGYREKFKKYEGRIYLPKFVIQEAQGWRDVNYEMDILSRIDWNSVNLKPLADLSLSEKRADELEVIVGLSDDKHELLKEKAVAHKEGGLELDYTFVSRQMLDIVPNPWVAYDIGKRIIKTLISKYDEKIAANNLAFIIEELRKRIEKERDRLAEGIFRELVEKKVLCFFLIVEKSGCKLPSRMKVKGSTIPLSSFIQSSLFEFVPGEGFNDTERSIALYLDGQEKLLWWYRNLSRQDYYVQGWKKYRIYPDFIFADNDEKRKDYSKIFVVETKGTHLKNDDTTYKKNVFHFCNELGARKDWKELNMEFADRRFEFQVVFGDEWQARINDFFREGAAS